VVGIIMIIVAALLVSELDPAARAYLEGRVETILDVFRASENLGQGVGSADIRWLSLLNIWATLSRNRSLLWGQGLGGGFTDQYRRFPEVLYQLKGGSAFTEEEMISGYFVRPHDNPAWVLLKMGIIGVLIYYGFVASLFWKGVRYASRFGDAYSRALVLGLVSSFPILFLTRMFTTKLQVMQGVLLGVLAVILAEKSGLQWHLQANLHGEDGVSRGSGAGS
jgi:hypothetical protein